MEWRIGAKAGRAQYSMHSWEHSGSKKLCQVRGQKYRQIDGHKTENVYSSQLGMDLYSWKGPAAGE